MQCITCDTALVEPLPETRTVPPVEPGMSADERRFWEKMTFRQFAILIIRIQALWLFFNAALDLTYLPRYALLQSSVSTYMALSPAGRLEFFMLVLRILLNIAAGVAIIQHAEKLLHWLVKDSIGKKPPGTND
jgi:hypothetical protein